MKINWNTKYTTIAIYVFLVILSSMMSFLAFTNIDMFKSAIGSVVTILTPFIIGFVIAYLLNFIMKFYESKVLIGKFFEKMSFKAKRGISILLTYISATLLISLFLRFVLPQLIESVSGLVSNIPQYMNNLSVIINDTIGSLEIPAEYVSTLVESWNGLVNAVVGLVSSFVPVIGNFLMLVTSSIFNVIIGIIISVYMLIDKEHFISLFKKLTHAVVSPKHINKVLKFYSKSNYIFGRFIGGKIIDSLIIGAITFVVLSMFKMPYVLLITTIVTVTNIIPFFGPFIGAIPSAIIILFVSPVQAMIFIAIIIVIQQIDGNIIGPYILGDSVGISAFWILFSVIVFAKLLGLVGMIIGVPVFAIIYGLVKEMFDSKLSKKGLSTNTADY